MARPIRETPILYGKYAERFVEEMKRVESLQQNSEKLIEKSYKLKSLFLTKDGI